MSFDETWSTATVNEGGSSNNTPPPEGQYELVLRGAGAFTSKQGNDVMRLEWEVASGPAQAGYEWSEIRGFGTQAQANAAKSCCHQLGVPVEEITQLSDLDIALKELIGGYFDANVSRNGEYLNVYVDGPTGGERAPAPAAAGADPGDDTQPVSDEDIPF